MGAEWLMAMHLGSGERDTEGEKKGGRTGVW